MAPHLHPNAPKIGKDDEINWGRTLVIGALMASAAAGAFGSKFMRGADERAENLRASLEIVRSSARDDVASSVARAMGMEEGLAAKGVSFGPDHDEIMDRLATLLADASMKADVETRKELESDVRFGGTVAKQVDIDGLQFDSWAGDLATFGEEFEDRIAQVQAIVEQAPIGKRLGEFAAWQSAANIYTEITIDWDVRDRKDTIEKLHGIPWPGQGVLAEADALSYDLLQKPMEEALRGGMGDFEWLKTAELQRTAGIEL